MGSSCGYILLDLYRIGMAVYYDHVENRTSIKLTLVVSLILSVGIYIYIVSCYGIYLNTNKYWKDRGKNMTKNLTKRMGG